MFIHVSTTTLFEAILYLIDLFYGFISQQLIQHLPISEIIFFTHLPIVFLAFTPWE